MNDMTPAKDLVRDAYGMTNFVYLDIETIPTQDPSVVEEIRKGVTPPSRMSKAETIEKWWKDEGDNAIQSAVDKTSFDGGRGHVCTIAWAKNDGEITSLHARDISEERDIIEVFFSSFDPYHASTIVGHNVAGFDIRFLLHRAVCLGITLPDAQSFPRDPKAWDKNVVDTMALWSGSRAKPQDWIGLDALCGLLGIPGKSGMDGSKVAQAWADGRHDEIQKYCADDVARTRAIHQRFLAVGY